MDSIRAVSPSGRDTGRALQDNPLGMSTSSRHHRAHNVITETTASSDDIMPKKLPSGSGLPVCWGPDMDRVLCDLEAANEVCEDEIVPTMKELFPILKNVSPNLSAPLNLDL